MSERKVPKLRFAGFTDDWKQRKLGDFLEVSKIKNLSDIYGREDVLSVSGDFGVVNQIEFQGRSFAGNSLSNYGVVETGSIIYTKSPLKSSPFGIIKTNKGRVGIVSTLYAIYTAKENTNPHFVQIYFESNSRLNSYLHPLVNKGAKNDMKISDENVLLGEVIFPTLEEQTVICNFFRQLDDTIAFHQREWEKYKNLKISYLEKMFPQKNENKPQLRFPNFTDAWKQRKLGEVLLVRNEFAEQHYFKIDIELENLEPETGRLIGDLSIRTKTNSIFKKGDILFGRLRPYLKKWHLTQTNGLKSGEIWAFYSTDEFCRNFIYLLVQTENFLKIANISAGTKMPRADWNLISQMSIFVPTLPEQQAIGEFFKQLDDTIAFHQRELEKYKNLKNGYLKQIFV